jgi:glycine hydroxymethyltransferase
MADVLEAPNDDKVLQRVAGEVKVLCDKFPVYGA